MSAGKPVTLEITLTSGTTIYADVVSWKIDRSALGMTLEWKSAPDGRNLIKLDLAHLAAIVEVAYSGPTKPRR